MMIEEGISKEIEHDRILQRGLHSRHGKVSR